MIAIHRRDFLKRMAQGALGAAAGLPLARATAAFADSASDSPKLNFVFVLMDDMGWMDTHCYGSQYYETPNADRLAEQGMRFTNAYAACPVCSPTRASILTGKYPARLHLTDWLNGKNMPYAKLRIPDWTKHLEPSEVTLAEALKAGGYTTACVGKWHLGNLEPYLPDKQGFDLAESLPTHMDSDPKVMNKITRDSLQFIEQNRDKPFFLYMAHHAVHLPIEASPELIKKYEGKTDPRHAQDNPAYAAMVEQSDSCLGRVLDKLDELGIADRTVVIFMSDNGGFSYISRDKQVTSNAPLREGKGTMYEGGVREPLIVRWPGVVRPGSTCDVPVISIDFYPTLLEIAGVADQPGHQPDGISFVPLLKETGPIQRDALYWHYPHYHHTTPAGSIRDGDDKLIEYFEDGHVELYNLKDDLSETTDLAARMPEKAKALQAKLAAWRKSVGAQMPTPNPDYDPKRANQPRQKGKGKAKKKGKADEENEE